MMDDYLEKPQGKHKEMYPSIGTLNIRNTEKQGIAILEESEMSTPQHSNLLPRTTSFSLLHPKLPCFHHQEKRPDIIVTLYYFLIPWTEEALFYRRKSKTVTSR